MADAPTIVALVLNWRLPDDTLRLLEDLHAAGVDGLRVLLIDNGSGDGSAERFAQAAAESTDTDCLAFAASRGHVFAALRGHFAALVAWPSVLRRRRPVQAMRTVPDRELLTALPMTANPGLADSGLKAWLRTSTDRFFAIYWKLVRRLCG